MAVSDQKQTVFHVLIREVQGNSLAVQQLGLCISSAEGIGSIPRQETRIPQAAQCSQKMEGVAEVKAEAGQYQMKDCVDCLRRGWG